ncbi:MAG TPA: RNA polymerase sigma factor [Bryobacteraceae bacterium]|nr:RNA polymerase sigma factor [Bryobacteraceae bacterium]
MTPLFGGAPTPDADDLTDPVLVERALEGDRDALHQLVERHQAFVFNVALKMFGQREDAEDLTQEVFVKVITSLRTFRNESALRTWLYRLTVNHFLKTRRRAFEVSIDGFETYFEGIAAVPDDEAVTAYGVTDQTVEELRLRCTSGMLMCLDREQRMTFILGAMFGLSHQEGAAALGTTPGNFRVRLHRARRDLYSWMDE